MKKINIKELKLLNDKEVSLKDIKDFEDNINCKRVEFVMDTDRGYEFDVILNCGHIINVYTATI